MRIDALVSSILKGIEIKASDVLAKAQIGDIIRAEVKATGDSVWLRLADGKTIEADSLVAMNVMNEELIDFLVTDKKDGKVFLETIKNDNPTFSNGLSSQKIVDMLSSLKMMITPKNIEIINEMVDRQVPINKENIHSVLTSLKNHEDIDIQKAVFLISNEFKPEEKNIQLLNKYSQGKIELGNQLKNVMNEMQKIDEPNLIRNIIEQIDEYENSSVQKQVLPVIKQVIIQNKEFFPNLKEFIVQNTANAIDTADAVSTVDIDDVQTVLDNMNPTEIKNLLNKMPQEPKNILEQFIKLQDENTNLNIPIKAKLIRLFQKHFIRVDSETLKDDLNMNITYKDVISKLEIVKENIKGTYHEQGFLSQSITQTQDNINFISHLSEYNSFIQIPLNVWGQNTSGELFVLRKSKKTIDPEDTSIFLSLEMPQMGTVEALIHVFGQNLSCNFRVSDQKVNTLFKNNFKDLANVLAKEGYDNVNLDSRIIQDKTTLLNVEKTCAESGRKRRHTLDVKI
jgi:hypothetical protein